MTAKKLPVDLVIIATIRPDILRVTLSSFKSQLLSQFEIRVIVNVDPIGESEFTQDDIVTICKHYFSNVISRTPKKPSFSEAVKWCWKQIETDYFFHLEDDWCLKRKINATSLIKMLDIQNTVSIRLNLTRNSKFESDTSGIVYSNGFSLNPSIMKTDYIKELLNRFDTTEDPEKQFIKNDVTPSYPKPKFLMYGKINDKSIVIDTGKKWRKSFSLNKWDSSKKGSCVWQITPNSPITFLLKIKYYIYLLYWRARYC